MKIIIVGLGQTGSMLVDELSHDQYDITVIDQDRSLVDKMTDKYNVNGIAGSGASKETLMAAGADTADAIIALTHIDEINLLSCMQAKALGTRRSAARIMSPDLVNEWESIRDQYKIDFLVKPKADIAETAFHNIGMPGFLKLEGYFGNNIQLIDMNILPGNAMVGKNLRDLRGLLHLDMLVVAAIREGKLIIPDGNFEIKEGDTLGIVTNKGNIASTLKSLGINVSSGKKIVIVGGGITTGYLLKLLSSPFRSITVLEKDPARCQELTQMYPQARIVYSGGEILDVLNEENVTGADTIFSLTDHDETNLVISMYAWSSGIPCVITRVDKPEHVKLLHRVNIDITVSMTEITVLKMVRFVRNYEMGDARNEIGKFYYIADNKAEIMEFGATESFPSLGIKLSDKNFNLKKDVLITAILRNGEQIIPSGNTSIEAGDRVVITASKKNKIRNLKDILK